MIPILTLVIGSMLFGATFFTTGLFIGYKLRGAIKYDIPIMVEESDESLPKPRVLHLETLQVS